MSKVSELLHLAVRQRDLLKQALHEDQSCPETQERIRAHLADLEGGFWPAGRTTRLCREWQTQGQWKALYHDAVRELQAHGLTALGPKLERLQAAHEALLDGLLSVYERDARYYPLEEHSTAWLDVRDNVAPAIPAKTGPDAAKADQTTEEPREILERLAMAQLLVQPGKPNASDIARSIGKPRTTLLSWDKFDAAYCKRKADWDEQQEKLRRRLKTGAQDETSDDGT